MKAGHVKRWRPLPRPVILRLLLVATGLFFVFCATLSLSRWHWTAGWLRDDGNLVVGRDFLNLWMVGKAAWHADPGRFYDPGLYNDWLRQVLGADYATQLWSYPPTLLLGAAPFGLLPYPAAYAVWILAGAGSLAWALRREKSGGKEAAILLLSPAAFLGILSGQACFLLLAALIAIFRQMDRRPALAGLLIGLISLKPQIGLLFPVFLICSGRWRVFLFAAGTVLALGFGVVTIYGTGPWREYLGQGIALQNTVLQNPPPFIAAIMPTVFMDAKWYGLSYGGAMAIQAVSSLIAAGLVGMNGWRRPDDPLNFPLFIAASVAASPYLIGYDLLPFSWAAILLITRYGRGSKSMALGIVCLGLPILRYYAAQYGIPGASLIPLLLAAWCFLQSRRPDAAPTAHGV